MQAAVLGDAIGHVCEDSMIVFYFMGYSITISSSSCVNYGRRVFHFSEQISTEQKEQTRIHKIVRNVAYMLTKSLQIIRVGVKVE